MVGGWFKASPYLRTFAGHYKSDGELEAALRAPKGSRAGYLVVLTHKGNLWVRFNPPHTIYGVDSKRELVQIVRQLLGERAMFLVTYRGKEWAGTTLIRPNAKLKLRRVESRLALCRGRAALIA